AIGALEGGGAGDIVVVAGADVTAVRAALPPGRTIPLLLNPAPERGQLSSLKVALRHVRAALPDAGAIVMALVDHPAVRASTVAGLIAAASDAAIVVPTYGGRRGHPVLFARSVWQE